MISFIAFNKCRLNTQICDINTDFNHYHTDFLIANTQDVLAVEVSSMGMDAFSQGSVFNPNKSCLSRPKNKQP
jgi:hypothetical protein